ncbi:hypothetical protein RZS08_49580, partial [Arthrospira platensis SPKY1]|nr:hypothetical protein [Arthrospira platensis SPKY1]
MAKIITGMSKVLFLFFYFFLLSFGFAQNEPYLGGIGRGDALHTESNLLLNDDDSILLATIYFGGQGRGDFHVTSSSLLLGES